MNRMHRLLVDGEIKYYLNHRKIDVGDRLRIKMPDESGEWREFEGTVKTAREAGVGASDSRADDLWVIVPSSRDHKLELLGVYEMNYV